MFLEVDAYEAAHDFVVQHSLLYTDAEVRRLAELASKSWGTAMVIPMREAHLHVFVDNPGVGEYRTQALVSLARGVERNYPPAGQVQQIMAVVFLPTYRKIMDGVPPEFKSPDEAAWQVGAILRATHPFMKGNMALAWLVENQLRLRHGLSVSNELRPKPLFDYFRNAVFYPLLEKKLYTPK